MKKLYLEYICFSLAVAAGEGSVDGGRDAPHLCDNTSRTRHHVFVQRPEVVPWKISQNEKKVSFEVPNDV